MKKRTTRNFWNEFGQVLKEGLVEDHANKDKLAKLLRFATTHTGNEAQDQSLDDYIGRAAKGQDKIYYILAENYATAIASPHIEQLKSRGVEVLLLTDRIDAWLTDGIERVRGQNPGPMLRERRWISPMTARKKTRMSWTNEHKTLLEKIQGMS